MSSSRFRTVSPVLLLAFLLQIFTAGGVGLTARPDGIASEPICSASINAERQNTPSSGHHQSGHFCLLCHIPGVAELDGVAGAFTAPVLVVHLVLWAFDSAFIQTAQTSEHARARAPPYTS